MPSNGLKVVVLGTGGTIAGTAASATDNTGYLAAQQSIDALVAAVPALAAVALETEQVAQVDSKDMDAAIWQRLAERIHVHLQRRDIAGIVVTHGTDTLEETAYFLHRLLAPRRPVVLTAAMRPATSLQADGPQNLLDAVTVVRHSQARGVVAVMAGSVFAATDLRKLHTWRLDAFGSGDAGPLARIEDGQLRVFRPWPANDRTPGTAIGGAAFAAAVMTSDPAGWPRVEIVMNHANADGRIVDALVAQGIDGLVLAGTGNGSVSVALEAAALQAWARGVQVLRASRCATGAVIGGDRADGALQGAGTLSAAQARVELLLRLLQSRRCPTRD